MSETETTLRARPAVDRRDARIVEARARTGIDEALIERLVRAFYARVRADEDIGPIFSARIVDWEPHLRQMNAFWASVTLSAGSYAGTPMQKHLTLPVEGRHFDRWLSLFEDTVREICAPEAAAVFLERAQRIAESLQLGIAHARGALAPFPIR